MLADNIAKKQGLDTNTVAKELFAKKENQQKLKKELEDLVDKYDVIL